MGCKRNDPVGLYDTREATITLKDNVSIYGGFYGNEDSLYKRNFNINQTTISGDFLNRNDKSFYSYHVVSAINVNNSAVIDGFTITNGAAAFVTNSTESQVDGGGIYCSCASPVFNNLIIKNNGASNNGGGVYMEFANLNIANTIIYDNNATSASYKGGAGMYLKYSKSKISNSKIISNQGVGIFLQNSDQQIINSIISNNVSDDNGAGIYCTESSPIVINTIISNNKSNGSDGGAGVYINDNSNPQIYNSILVNNTGKKGNSFYMSSYSTNASFKVCSSLVQGGNVYGIPNYINNIDVFPRFTNPSVIIGYDKNAINSDWSLLPCSPLIDKGNNSYFTSNILKDIIGNARINNDTIDIGPFEFRGTKSVKMHKQIIYVKQGGVGDGSSWTNALGNLQSAIDHSIGCYDSSEVWVAKGTYIPDTTGLSNHKDAAFSIRNNHIIYGGFFGNETSLIQRNLMLNKTILSGNIGNIADSTDNCTSIVKIENQDSLVLLDGFDIIQSNSDDFSSMGCGVYCSNSNVKLKNLFVHDNKTGYYGGSLYGSGGKVDISNSFFYNNTTSSSGTINLNNTAGDIQSCLIYNNNADAGFGSGGIAFQNVKGNIVNCVLSGNKGSNVSAISTGNSKCAIVNSTIVNNNSDYNRVAISAADSILILNSLVWNDSYSSDALINFNPNKLTIKNSIIKNIDSLKLSPTNLINSFDVNPIFCRLLNQNGYTEDKILSYWKLKSCSPAINQGFYDSQYYSTNVDLDNNSRIYNNGTIDIGAFEYQGDKKCNHIKFIVTSGINPISGINVGFNGTNQWGKTDINGVYQFDNISVGDSYQYVVSNNSSFFTMDSIRKLQNDTIIYINFNGIDEKSKVNNISISPNPANDIINIQMGEKVENLDLYIYNISGQELRKEHIINAKAEIDVSMLDRGVYIFKLISKDFILSRRVIKA